MGRPGDTTDGHRVSRPPVSSYRSPKTAVRQSQAHGRGLYAIAPIRRGEIVAIKGGHVIDRNAYEQHRSVIGAADLQIADGFYLAPLSEEEHDSVMMFLNHSCEPNVGVQGQIVFVAMRDVTPGEELTIDYAMIDDSDDEMTCRCGAVACRQLVSGQDWRRTELQRKYGRYFSAYLLEKLEAQERA